MKNKLGLLGIVAVFGVATLGLAAGTSKAIRATELNGSIWNDFEQGLISDLLVEFRAGDRLPVTLEAQGDLIETTETAPSYVVVKRPFWVKVGQRDILMSLDGTLFKPIQEMARGSFTAGASSDQGGGGVASAIQLLFKAYLR